MKYAIIIITPITTNIGHTIINIIINDVLKISFWHDLVVSF